MQVRQVCIAIVDWCWKASKAKPPAWVKQLMVNWLDESWGPMQLSPVSTQDQCLADLRSSCHSAPLHVSNRSCFLLHPDV